VGRALGVRRPGDEQSLQPRCQRRRAANLGVSGGDRPAAAKAASVEHETPPAREGRFAGASPVGDQNRGRRGGIPGTRAALANSDFSLSQQKEFPMSLSPNRISAFGPFSPGREVALARELLEVQSERELDRFLPLLAAAAPMIANIAGPLLKSLAGGLFGGGGKKKKPRDDQEYFLGGIVKGLLGGEIGENENENEFGEYESENENESYEQEQFLGGLLKGVLGGELESYEQEQFLGGIIGKLFGGGELESNYVQEQFLGGILKGLIGGELEYEAPGADGHRHLLRLARRFVRFVNAAACHAAAELANLQRAGHRPGPPELQRIVLGALVTAARGMLPRLAAVAFPGEPAAHAAGPAPGGGGPGFTVASFRGGAPSAAGGPGGQTMLELMFAEAAPLGGSPSPGRRVSAANGYPLG
jgi:hypothetical protein